MVALRIVLAGLVIFMGVARLRIILVLLGTPTSYQERDILQEYLMGKAIIGGVNPYLPLDQLAQMFIGKFSFMTHPAPHPPFLAILSIPFSPLSLHQVIVVWFVLEMVCLAAIAIMLTYLWKGKINWLIACFLVFIMLAWYPVMVDLLFGQITIPLTALLLGALLAWRKERNILAGMLIGLTVAIKMFSWPLIIYFAIKRDWRAFLSSCATVIGLNLIALLVMGFGPVSNYYLHVTMQVSAIYHSFLKNYSLWSIGYRLFEGTRPIGGDFLSAPPLIDFPAIAPIVSAGLAVIFLAAGLVWAAKSRDKDIAYSIMLCVIVAVSPIAWDHYYVMIIVSLAILLLNLSRRAFPNLPTIIFLLIAALLFLFNEYIGGIIVALNGGATGLLASGNRISFASSLLETLPTLELLVLTFLLWRAGQTKTIQAL